MIRAILAFAAILLPQPGLRADAGELNFEALISSERFKELSFASAIQYFPASGGMERMDRVQVGEMLMNCRTDGVQQGSADSRFFHFVCQGRKMSDACFTGNLKLGVSGATYLELSLHEVRDNALEGCSPFGFPAEQSNG